MKELSILIGGKAGFGIDKAGFIIGRIFNRLNYRIYIYRDYPSLIRGGHTFSIIRLSGEKISAHRDNVDFILALNQDVIKYHANRLKENSVIIYDSDSVKAEGLRPDVKTIGISIDKIIKEEKASEIMRNTCIIGALCKAAKVSWDTLENILRKEMTREIDLNLKVARRGYDASGEFTEVAALSQKTLPMLSGNQAMGLGLIRGGLNTYIAYPMTPSSPVLHFLADTAKDFSLKVIHPESEIGVILMALGASYAGEKAAVGTSGGGFCLMTEALSMAGMTELPVVIILGQRPGPSTGLPTYSAQTELLFALNAGQGEFTRFVVAPGDLEEAYFWSAVSLNISCKYQLPSIVLSDKNLGEGIFNFDINSVRGITIEPCRAFAPTKDAVIKVNSYEHDESGITTEDPGITVSMQDKRLAKEKLLAEEIDKYDAVSTYGNEDSKTGILCWGSNKGICVEIAKGLGLKVVQPVVMSPFPSGQFAKAVEGLDRLIAVENNATGQLVKLLRLHGFDADEAVLKYDGRPFSVDELEEKLRKIL